ncbi:MAG TPA: pyridoxal phosphate-dependent aminotransferase [Saprospiraceae bacterium]|jgi:aspartate aminotransferase|nr:pyridoxal phosphate-dependent aminotransferase [Candidatus Parvibacillus calidus]MCO5283021.1 pyridoxal phosphate-dependent aminotransferase [Saprospiraceae bacterium]WKZ63112.1 MAG: pyridoxal phosphate-dependent aminotransferase [Saprospiraceae bacterium]HMY83168.1 pyridoxal phosphate-dependent aminotransferase [Saprospiraceae bacterium]HMZ25469.1 pyridoxal phosphate-dependent aminotransferase [Saprospiraceae bacterium]
MGKPVVYHLADRIVKMVESATLQMTAKARKLKQEGKDVINLSIGEPDFDTPQFIKDAAKVALDQGYTKYTPVSGLIELKRSIQEKFKRDNNIEYALDEIVVSNGAKQSIANVAMSVLNEGDEVIIFAPYWVSYLEIVHLAGGVPVIVHAGIENDFKVLPSQLEAAITPKTRMVIFSSPCNPTGSVYSMEELQAFAEILGTKDEIYIVSDEIYEYINYTGNHASIASIPSVKDQTITINGFSKGFAMTGWRLGYMGAPREVAKATDKMQGQFTSGAASFSQKAASLALETDLTETYKMRDAFLKRRDLILNLLKEIPGIKCNVPEGAFYVFPNVSAYYGKKTPDGTVIENGDHLCTYILDTAYVALVAGSAFGDEECIRISYAASDEEIIEACKRIKEALSHLN